MRREKGEERRKKGEGRREKGEGRREKGEGRRGKGEERREKGRREGRREKERAGSFCLFVCWSHDCCAVLCLSCCSLDRGLGIGF